MQLAFPSDYLATLPHVILVDYKIGGPMFLLTRDILRSDTFQGTRPCPERLMRELVDALAGRQGHVPLKFAPPQPPPVRDKPYPNSNHFPTIQGMWDHMHGLHVASLDYPPIPTLLGGIGSTRPL